MESKFIICEANLMEEETVESLIQTVKPDKMIHLAWELKGGDAFQKSNTNLDWLSATLNLIKLFVKYGGKRIVFAGSSSEYGFSDTKLEETMQMVPINLYGRCKKAVSEIAYEYCLENNVAFATARYFSVYGKNDLREGRAIVSAIDNFYHKKNVECKMPHNIWDYIFVEDAAKATVELLASDYSGIMNISSGKGVEMGQVFKTIAALMDKRNLLTLCEENKKGYCLVGANEKMRSILGITELTELEVGLKNTIDWYISTTEK
jgi:nucleoside-diphosphate-sugar epimerase